MIIVRERENTLGDVEGGEAGGVGEQLKLIGLRSDIYGPNSFELYCNG